jgi:hypothetical protein
MPPDDLLLRIALDPRGPLVPPGHPPLGVEHVDRVVAHALDQQPQAQLLLAQLVRDALALGGLGDQLRVGQAQGGGDILGLLGHADDSTRESP